MSTSYEHDRNRFRICTKTVDEFKKFYDNSRSNPPGEYKTYVIKNDNNDKIDMLTTMLRQERHKIWFWLKAQR